MQADKLTVGMLIDGKDAITEVIRGEWVKVMGSYQDLSGKMKHGEITRWREACTRHHVHMNTAGGKRLCYHRADNVMVGT